MNVVFALNTKQTNKQTEARVLKEFRSFLRVLPPNVRDYVALSQRLKTPILVAEVDVGTPLLPPLPPPPKILKDTSRFRQTTNGKSTSHHPMTMKPPTSRVRERRKIETETGGVLA